MFKLYFYLFIIVIFKYVLSNTQTCDISEMDDCEKKDDASYFVKRYILYDVNPGEGFNLRRDVYMRIASLVRQLRQSTQKLNWILVLPPWGPLYHWKSPDIEFQKQISWSSFFDINSLNEYVPVIEFNTFLKENGPEIDELYYLQHYADFSVDGQWNERWNIQECSEESNYHMMADGNIYGWFWGYNNVHARDFHCLSIQGTSSTLKPVLQSSNYKSIMIDRAEVILHDAFGGLDYWMIRKSMKFSKHLIAIGNKFRLQQLNSSNDKDMIIYGRVQPEKVDFSIGGPYLGVHLRRQDFVKARPNDVPSIFHAASQIKAKLLQLNLATVFVATDASVSEFEELQKYVPGAKKFYPSKAVKQKIKDGGIAIVEQWICAHSRYFIGTYESTFSFRIHEEREILGFHPDTTFNRFCGDNQTSCKQSTRWTIVNS